MYIMLKKETLWSHFLVDNFIPPNTSLLASPPTDRVKGVFGEQNFQQYSFNINA